MTNPYNTEEPKKGGTYLVALKENDKVVYKVLKFTTNLHNVNKALFPYPERRWYTEHNGEYIFYNDILGWMSIPKYPEPEKQIEGQMRLEDFL